jgi:hypothetical protein
MGPVKEEILNLGPLVVGLVSLVVAFVMACGNLSTSTPPAFSADPSPTALNRSGTALSTNTPRSTPGELTMDEETIIRGVITENYLGCTLDVSCFLRLRDNVQEIVVIYHLGEYPRCLNEKAVDFGLEARVGDEIEVFGKVTANREISTCDSRDYYIRKKP